MVSIVITVNMFMINNFPPAAFAYFMFTVLINNRKKIQAAANRTTRGQAERANVGRIRTPVTDFSNIRI